MRTEWFRKKRYAHSRKEKRILSPGIPVRGGKTPTISSSKKAMEKSPGAKVGEKAEKERNR